MATYDTFIDPATGEEHQSKAFGKGMKTYRAGHGTDSTGPSG